MEKHNEGLAQWKCLTSGIYMEKRKTIFTDLFTSVPYGERKKFYETFSKRNLYSRPRGAGKRWHLKTLLPAGVSRRQYYLLLAAGLLPLLLLLLLLLALLEPLDPEKSLVMSSETSGSSGLGFSMFMDCSISCKRDKTWRRSKNHRPQGSGSRISFLEEERFSVITRNSFPVIY